MIRFVKERIREHRKNYRRYDSEVKSIVNMRYISKKNKFQFDYSYSHKYRELDMIDELEMFILKKLIKTQERASQTKPNTQSD